MIIAVFFEETNVCHTVFDTGDSPWEVPSNGLEIAEYNLDYLDSYHDGTEWILNPDRVIYEWNSESMSYVNRNAAMIAAIEAEEAAAAEAAEEPSIEE